MAMTLRRRILDRVAAGVLVLVPLLVLRAHLAGPATDSWLNRGVIRVTAPMQGAVTWVVVGIGRMVHDYVAVVGVNAENRELRDVNDQLRAKVIQLEAEAAELRAMAPLLALKVRAPADTLTARIIAAPMNAAFRILRIRIDRGAHDVAVGMPVVSPQGPVGRVDRVVGGFADVMLISDPALRTEVVIKRTGGRGIMAGLGRSDAYTCSIGWLEKASASGADAVVKVGDEVVTSGLGTIFPAGLPIGKVTRVTSDNGMFQSVEVEPMVDLARLRAVVVLLAPPPPADPEAGAKKVSPPALGSGGL